MEKLIFSGYGIDIVRKGGCYYIQYNDGGLVGKEIESKITEDEAIKAQKSPKNASEIIILTQVRDEINTPKF